MHRKLEMETRERQGVQARMLEVEKKNSELLVDLGQLQNQLSQLQDSYRSEQDKVSETVIWILYIWANWA